MNTAQFRQSFLDFFKTKGHAIVPSDSLLPRSPNLLFTNAGMNQFVPYFLGEITPKDRRIVNTQKCIRAGGKHNDLDDVGLDTYHQTFFEMLGNWSIGDYFKRDAIHWAWELLTRVWKFPKNRLYATVYKPADGDPAEFDQEAYAIWQELFEKDGLDPAVHICTGGKKDNFWMMGDTGPCGPCSEVHIDLTPNGDTAGKLVNMGSPLCMEIWNLVFIQFNADGKGGFVPLKEQHVDTGMGLERVAGIYATTNGFKDFSKIPSNYNSDVFAPVFAKITALSGQQYGSLVPNDRDHMSVEEQSDCAFRIIADHIRTLSFAIADGILPGNEGRNYVLRRILRRGLLYGKRLHLPEGFFASLVEPLVSSMGGFFQELRQHQTTITKVIATEEAAFERTLGRGLQLFEKIVTESKGCIDGAAMFTLYDTYGFPVDLTTILAKERDLTVDNAGFEAEMEKQRERARAAHKKTAIQVRGEGNVQRTEFVGYERLEVEAQILEYVKVEQGAYLVLDKTPFYAEMGGQVGDCGILKLGDTYVRVQDTTVDADGRVLHKIDDNLSEDVVGQKVLAEVDVERRQAIQRHHTATHLLHYALRKVLGTHVQQKGSLVSDTYLRFDFAHFAALTRDEVHQVECLTNALVLRNYIVTKTETSFENKPSECLAFFGEKYGDKVRVVDVGGVSKELCGGTHVAATGEIGLIKILQESAIAAGTRRITAIAGECALQRMQAHEELLRDVSEKLKCTVDELPDRADALVEHQKNLEKQLKAHAQQALAMLAKNLAQSQQCVSGVATVRVYVEVADTDALKSLSAQVSHAIDGVAVLVARIEDNWSFVANCTTKAIAAGQKAGAIVKTLAQRLNGRGGGRDDFAMGGAPYQGKVKIFD